jgi:hypothetical protein
MTPLDKPLKRALKVNGSDYVVTLTPDTLKITQKGHRVGVELKWAELPRKPKNLARRATATSPHRVTSKRTPPKRSR